ncbi:MAG: hypothetical protein AAFQ94_09435 [Bacteroidota bacterium]
MSVKSISVKVTKNIEVSINSREDDKSFDENQPAYAINWFNTKRAWLYKAYSLLAVRSVLKIGGRPFFKAKCHLIEGDPALNRKVLLIVKYPNPGAFLQLVRNKYFQVISIFRNASVDQFTFGFASKTSNQRWEKPDNSHYYILHHFQAETTVAKDLIRIVSETSSNVDLQVFFSGKVDKCLVVKSSTGSERQISNLIDELIIYRSQDRESLEQVLKSEKYQSLIDSKLKASSLVELKREI